MVNRIVFREFLFYNLSNFRSYFVQCLQDFYFSRVFFCFSGNNFKIVLLIHCNQLFSFLFSFSYYFLALLNRLSWQIQIFNCNCDSPVCKIMSSQIECSFDCLDCLISSDFLVNFSYQFSVFLSEKRFVNLSFQDFSVLYFYRVI